METFDDIAAKCLCIVIAGFLVRRFFASGSGRRRRLSHGTWNPDRAAETIREHLADERHDLESMHPFLGAIPAKNPADWILAIHFYLPLEQITLERIWPLTAPVLKYLRSARLLFRFAIIGITVHAIMEDKTSERVLHVWSKVNALEDLPVHEAKDLAKDFTDERFAWFWYIEPGRLDQLRSGSPPAGPQDGR